MDLPTEFDDLFSNDAVDELVSRRGLRTPFVRVAKDGKTFNDRDFTRSGGVGAMIADQVSDDRLLEHFAGGATLVLQALHRTWGPIIDFAGQLGSDLGHPVQANAYVTPAQNTGFAAHYDVHDVFVVQIAGTKRWQIREPVHALPLRTQPWEQRADAVREAANRPPLLDIELHPGDVLYLPRGYLHSAAALGAISTHLTLGIHAWTRMHLTEQLSAYAVERLADDVALRTSLPLGLDWSREAVPEQEFERVRAALIDALRAARPTDVAERLHAGHRASGRAAPLPPVASVVAAGVLRGHEVLRLRPHLAATLVDSQQGMHVVTRAGRCSLEPSQVPGARALLRDGQIAVAGLGVDLARRLVLAGVATIEIPPPS